MGKDLSTELKHKIEQEAKDYANLEICDWGKIKGNKQLHDWELAHDIYKDAAEGYAEKWQEEKKAAIEAKKLLDEVFRKHEAGLLPDRFVYEKIKDFLYPTDKSNKNE